jgi:myo-inositol 2-dehydrogenase/D-chiro-inositol 1-dehydrogenase
MQKSLRLGVIGCGRAAIQRHLPQIIRLGTADIVAAADPDPIRLAAVGDRFHIPNLYSDVHTLLDEIEVDVIAVIAPVTSHAEIVLAGLDAGKHVFVEKPMCATLEEADQIREKACRIDRKVLVGLNFRYHRLVQQARALLRQKALGQVEAIRSVFSSVHEEPSHWQTRRYSGGGALFDQGIHLFDLWRFLLESEVEDVFAMSRSGPWEDETATVSAKLANGVLATATCSERSGENCEIEIYGREGRLNVSCYRFDGLEFFPKGSIPGNGRGRVSAFTRTLKQLPTALTQLRQGGDVLASYGEQWRHFLEAIRLDRPMACSVDDGRRAMEIAFAAMASASSGRPVKMATAPGPDVSSRAPNSNGAAFQVKGGLDNARPPGAPLAMSVIIAGDCYETIRQTIGHLMAQKGRERLELVIVTSSKDGSEFVRQEIVGFWQIKVVDVPSIFPLSLAASAGIRHASAPLVVFAESHAFPAAGWAEALIEAHRDQSCAAVGAVIGNANPGVLSWANLFVDYGPCVEPSAARNVTYPPGHHTAYKRDVLLQYDSQLEAVMDSEILLHWDMRAKGHRLRLEAAARILHVNISSLAAWLPERFYSGRRFAGTRGRHWSLLKRLLYAGGSPLIPIVRIPRVCRDLLASTLPPTRWPLILPAIVIGLLASSVGEAAGYLFGAGDAAEQAARMELFKMEYLTERDRRDLKAWYLNVAHQANAWSEPRVTND